MKEEPSITVSSLCPDNNDVTGKYVATQKETTLHDFLMSFAVTRLLLHAYSYTPTRTRLLLHAYSYTPAECTAGNAQAARA